MPLTVTLAKVDRSRTGPVSKYTIKLNRRETVEVILVRHYGHPDTIIVPTQIGCAQDCKFCKLSAGRNIPHDVPRPIWPGELLAMIELVAHSAPLVEHNFVVSFAGTGEPLVCIDNLRTLVPWARRRFADYGLSVAFEMTTSMPEVAALNVVLLATADVFKGTKLCLSLNFVDDVVRAFQMPTAMGVESSLDLLNFYKHYTKNQVEVHYTLISQVNDSTEQATKLAKLLKDRDLHLKLFSYMEPGFPGYYKSANAVPFGRAMRDKGFDDYEIVQPEGIDIGGAQGQFFVPPIGYRVSGAPVVFYPGSGPARAW